MFQNLINIITAPQAAFDSLKEKPTALMPLLLIIALSGGMQILYFANIDLDFLIDQLVIQSQAFINIPENELRESLADTNPITQGISSAIAIAIFLPLITAIMAGYLSFVSKFTSDEIGFKRWFCLAAWTSVVTIFAAIAGIAVVLMSADGMIALSQLQALSLNSLIFQTTGPFKTLLSSLDITQLWALVLLILGYKSWTGKTLASSICIGGAPYFLIYGIWALIILV